MISRRAWPAAVLLAMAAPLAAVAGGAVATTHYARLADIGLALLIVVFLLVERFGPGLVVGLLALGGLNALPGPNLQTTHVALSFTAQDACVIALVAVLALLSPGRPGSRPRASAIERPMVLWAGVFLTLWLVTVGRTVIGSPVPLHRALYWCMDFAAFAALIPLFARAFRDEGVLRVFIVTFAIGAVISALAQSYVVVSR